MSIDVPLFFAHYCLYRSCRPSGSHTTLAVSAVSSVMRALMECPSPWTLKIRSTVSKTTTGEHHLKGTQGQDPDLSVLSWFSMGMEKKFLGVILQFK